MEINGSLSYKVFHQVEELIGWELYDYLLSQPGAFSYQFCGHAINHVFFIKKGNDHSVLGSDCVRKIAAAQKLNSMEGILSIPKKHRSRVKVNKKLFDEEFTNLDDLPY